MFKNIYFKIRKPGYNNPGSFFVSSEFFTSFCGADALRQLSFDVE